MSKWRTGEPIKVEEYLVIYTIKKSGKMIRSVQRWDGEWTNNKYEKMFISHWAELMELPVDKKNKKGI
jgi:hypothetical protein